MWTPQTLAATEELGFTVIVTSRSSAGHPLVVELTPVVVPPVPAVNDVSVQSALAKVSSLNSTHVVGVDVGVRVGVGVVLAAGVGLPVAVGGGVGVRVGVGDAVWVGVGVLHFPAEPAL